MLPRAEPAGADGRGRGPSGGPGRGTSDGRGRGPSGGSGRSPSDGPRRGWFSTSAPARASGLSTIDAARPRMVDNHVESRRRPVYRPDSARTTGPAAEDGAHEGPGETRP